MKIKVIWIGKTEESYLKEGISIYLNRLKHYTDLIIKEIPDLKQQQSLSKEQVKEKEGELILKELENGHYLVLLDEKGKEFRSIEMAAKIETWQNSGIKNLVLVIGGAFGFSKSVYDRAQFQWSLSKLTFSHQMVRLFLCEQLYRSYSILKGEKYHHE